MPTGCPSREELDRIFPPERTNEFFEALFGDVEEGAYDIRLVCRQTGPAEARFAFELMGRPGKCLRCNLTRGLPRVFERHPVINAAAVASGLARLLGWPGEPDWSLGATEESSDKCHYIPLILKKPG